MQETSKLLEGIVVVGVGKLPLPKKKWEALIIGNGGKISTGKKGDPITHFVPQHDQIAKYHEKARLGKRTRIHTFLSRGATPVRGQYFLDCIEKGERLDITPYLLDLGTVHPQVNLAASLPMQPFKSKTAKPKKVLAKIGADSPMKIDQPPKIPSQPVIQSSQNPSAVSSAAVEVFVQRVDVLEQENRALQEKLKTALEAKRRELEDLSLAELKKLENEAESWYKLVSAARVEAEMNSKDGKKECVVCLENERGVVFLPCRHQCCCKNCGTKIDKCPICRVAIKEKMEIFIS